MRKYDNRVMTTQWMFRVPALLALAILSGCGSGETYYDTTGVVTLDGAPVDDASITMVPVDETTGKHAHASTRDGGKFQMYTIQNEGMLAGDYKVTVQKFDTNTGRKDQMESLLPAPYSAAEQTPLKVTIPHEGELTLELKSN